MASDDNDEATDPQPATMPAQTRISTLISNLHSVRTSISALSAPQPVRLVLVSKLKPASDILALHTPPPSDDSSSSTSTTTTTTTRGEDHFGENYIQELHEKARALPRTIKWHFIGGLQSNKAKALASKIPNLWCVSSVDSTKKANLLDKGRAEAAEAAVLEHEVDNVPDTSTVGGGGGTTNGEPLRVMVQVNTSGEESKSGVTPGQETVELAKHILENCSNLKFHGLMTIGAIARSQAAKEGEENEDFNILVETRDEVAQAIGLNKEDIQLSMGMSADFEGAIKAGSNEVRIGSTIFGERPPKNAV